MILNLPEHESVAGDEIRKMILDASRSAVAWQAVSEAGIDIKVEAREGVIPKLWTVTYLEHSVTEKNLLDAIEMLCQKIADAEETK